MLVIKTRATCVINTATTVRVTIPGLTTVPSICTIGSSSAGTWSSTSLTIPAGTDEYQEVTFTPSASGSHVLTVTSNNQPTSTLQIGVNTSGTFALVDLIRPEIYLSPCNWDILDTGDYTDVTGPCIQTGNSGAYFKFRIVDTNECWMRINPVIYGLMPAGEKPYIRVSVNGGNWSINQVSGQDYQLFGGTAPADIIVQIRIAQYVANDGNGTYPRWSSDPAISLVNGIRILSLFVPAGGDIEPYPFLKPNTMICYGDSISDGTGAGVPSGNDALHAFHQHMGTGLSAEVGAIGFGGMGWLTQGSWMDANFLGSWATFSNGRPRDFTGLTYLLVNMGTNDFLLGSTPGATIQTTVQNWLPTARSLLPASTKIVLMAPPADYYNYEIQVAMNAYQASSGDQNVYFVAASDYFNVDALTALTGTWWSADSYHPNFLGHAHLAIAYQKSLYDKIGVYGSQANYETCSGGYS